MNSNPKKRTLLFLCTGNSARSILAEYLGKKFGGDKFDFYSAGSSPKPQPNPLAIKTLSNHFQIDASDARSKSWEEFNDVHFDFVITLCDNAKESCPIWPGQPIIAHWGSTDPSDVEGTQEEKEHAFWTIAQQIKRRIELLWSLPFEKLDTLRLTQETKNIGTVA